MNRNTLDEVAERFNTDKVSNLHDFLRFYHRRLSHLRDEKFVLYEVGVLNGGSVKTWEAYFPNATIVGIDIDPRCTEFEGGNIHIRIGDASRVDFMFDLVTEFGRPTVFVEDGSHRWDHQISTLQTMFPLVVPGGFYIMEDIDTSFQEHLEKAPFEGLSTISAVDYLFKLARVVIGERALKDEKPYDLFINDWAPWVGSVDLGRRTSVISKKLAPGGGPI